MFDIFRVNQARIIAMQKRIKIPNIEFNGSATSHMEIRGC